MIRVRGRIRDGERRAAAAVLAAGLALTLLLSGADSARGSFPGAFNGQITFNGGGQSGNDQIFVMGPAGQNPTDVVNDYDNNSHPAFSADGRRIVFTGEDDELYVMDADGHNSRRLTNTEADERQAAFSPDGNFIAFGRSSANGSAGDELWLMRSDGTDARRLTPANPRGSSPSFSPDGLRIAFDRGTDIYVLGPGGEQRLTSNPAIDRQPSYSPDGSRIAFTSDRDGNNEIYVMNADGSNQTRLTNNPAPDSAPVFSPDGRKIAFERYFGEGNPDEPGLIFEGGPNTDPNAEDTAPDPLSQVDIFVANADGKNPVNLTRTPDEIERQPDWQPLGPDADRTPPKFSGGVSIASPPGRARAARTLTIGYRLSEAASAKLAVERLARGIRLQRRGIRLCVRSTARNRRTAARQIRSRLGARARGPEGRRRVRRALLRARCTYATVEGWLVRRSKRGRNQVRFSGRAKGKRLARGSYRIRAGAVDSTANPARQKPSKRFRLP